MIEIKELHSNLSHPNALHLDPSFISGFVQADGCFYVHAPTISTAETTNCTHAHKQRRITPSFCVTQLDSQDGATNPLLSDIQEYFGAGHYIRDRRNGCSTYRINSIKRLLDKVIPHFDQYPLYEQKGRDYKIFREIVFKLSKKIHLFEKGKGRFMI